MEILLHVIVTPYFGSGQPFVHAPVSKHDLQDISVYLLTSNLAKHHNFHALVSFLDRFVTGL